MKLILNRRRKILCLLIASLMIVAISSPLIVEACKTKEKEDYDLDLSVDTKSGTATIVLKAKLILITETWLHHWISKCSPISGALVYFYSCDKKTYNLKELGTAKTDKNGYATFSWSATKAGDYWFTSGYISGDGTKHDGHS